MPKETAGVIAAMTDAMTLPTATEPASGHALPKMGPLWVTLL